MWKDEGGISQSAYQIVCTINHETVWDTGKVQSSSMRTMYNGKPLQSKDRVIWKVRVWDEKDQVEEYSSAYFEMGLLEGFHAKWITGNYKPKTKKSLVGDYLARKAERYPVDCFKKVFECKDIQKARLYITACGLYEAYINDKRVGDFIMAPGYTDYRKRVQYQTYDVTDLLIEGNNVLTVFLADGWYRGSTGAWGLLCQYGIETKLLVQLEMDDMTIISDDTWDWSNDGPIRFADNKDGEIVDASMKPSFDKKAKCTNHTVMPSASNNVSVKEHEHFKPDIIKTPLGKTIYNFKQNIAGYVSFKVKAHKGDRIYLRFGEILDDKGEFTQNNIQCKYKDHISPLQEVTYICKEGWNAYKTTFSIFGFQYVLVESNLENIEMEAIAVYSDLERTGYFESSNSLLNQFFENTVWSAKGNFLDIPTDCPTRERHGWTGDIQIFTRTANYLFNFMPFAKKYLNDVFDVQYKDGKVVQIAPVGGTDFFMKVMDGSVGWADVAVLMPYQLYKQYQDKRILQQFYPNMEKYIEFMQKRSGKKTLLSKPLKIRKEDRKYATNYGQIYGEWAEPEDVNKFKIDDFIYPHPEEATAYTSYVHEKMSEICSILDKKEKEKEYSQFALSTKKAYQSILYLQEFSLDTDRQAKLVRPLYMNLLNEEQRKYAEKRLIKALENYRWRIGTGFLSTPLILYVLEKLNIEYAYRLLENEEVPGWLAMPKKGATTIWESWECDKHEVDVDSRNHYSKGSMCEWLFASMCGINIEAENAFIIAPKPGGHFTYAKAQYDSIYGMVESGWKKVNNTIVYTVSIPSNCKATFIYPDGRKEELHTGIYIL